MVNLLDIADIVGKAVDKYDGKKMYVSTGALNEDIIDMNKCEYFNYIEKPSRANLQVSEGDIIFAKMQWTKKTLIIDKDNSQNMFSTGFCAIKPKNNKITTKCLYYLISSEIFLKNKDKNCSGATQKAITNEGLSKICINLPQIEEQEKICNYLDKIIELNRKYRKQIALLDTLIKARFVEMFGDISKNSKEWINDKMGDYMTLLTDFSSNGSYKSLDSNVIMKDEPDYAWMVRTTDLEEQEFEKVKYVDEQTYNYLSKSKLYGDEIIMCKIGSAGRIFLMPNINKPATLGRNAFMFRYDDRINRVYLYHYLTTEHGKQEIMSKVRGAVTKTITKEDARDIDILVPPIDLQNSFAAFVKEVDKLKFDMQKSLEKTQVIFDSLMQEYFG